MGYAIIDLTTGKRFGYLQDEIFPTASTIKTAVAIAAVQEVDEGIKRWTDKKVVPPSNPPGRREASMWSYWFKDGTSLDMDGWVNLMLTVSDNTATMVMRDWIGVDNINARMKRLGLPNTRILWPGFPADQVELRRLRGQFGLGMTTPNEMARLFELLYHRKAASPAASEKIVRILKKQYWDDFAGLAAPVEITVASKSGAISRSRSEAAIVYGPRPYVITVYTDSQKDRRWTLDNAGEVAIRELCKIAWEGMTGKPFKLPAGFEKFWPTGGGVEDS